MDDLYLSELQGEEKLLAMILHQAVKDIQDEQHKREAWKYFINTDETDPHSFIPVCRGLGLDEDIFFIRIKNYYLHGKPLVRASYGNLKIPGDFSTQISDLEL